ncbi:hypothetical protein T05_13872 [Trichinella murrelli]|uniref:Uncharacterized protein n=1 Tax=Trichinella murrelli TaxID=144512 RepID=A0A0V0T2A3_9BILA|nr:hypothetical protein T05_13872 [Trichinella murrelli]
MVFVRISRAMVLKVWVERGLFTHRILLGEEMLSVPAFPQKQMKN